MRENNYDVIGYFRVDLGIFENGVGKGGREGKLYILIIFNVIGWMESVKGVRF